jgi:phage-related protein
MSKHILQQYSNLVLANEAFKDALDLRLSKTVRQNILDALLWLNKYGTDREYMGKRIENMGRKKIWELKIKGDSKTEWRFLFKKVPTSTNPPTYALLNFFQKTDEQISDRDFNTAVRIAKREGW